MQVAFSEQRMIFRQIFIHGSFSFVRRKIRRGQNAFVSIVRTLLRRFANAIELFESGVFNEVNTYRAGYSVESLTFVNDAKQGGLTSRVIRDLPRATNPLFRLPI